MHGGDHVEVTYGGFGCGLLWPGIPGAIYPLTRGRLATRIGRHSFVTILAGILRRHPRSNMRCSLRKFGTTPGHRNTYRQRNVTARQCGTYKTHIGRGVSTPYWRPTPGRHMALLMENMCRQPDGGGQTYCACFRGKHWAAPYGAPRRRQIWAGLSGPARCAVWRGSKRGGVSLRLIWPAVWRLNPRKRLDPLHPGARRRGFRAPHNARRGGGWTERPRARPGWVGEISLLAR